MIKKRSSLSDQYFEWIIHKIRLSSRYSDLIKHLYNTPFIAILFEDNNRISDGLDLVYRFAYEANIEYSEIDEYFTHPRVCSVLELMLALAIKMEDGFLFGAFEGSKDCTWRWFSIMIHSLRLDGFTNEYYDFDKVDYILNTFINRKYSPDGHGGLFVLDNCDCDLTQMGLYEQMCQYSNYLLERQGDC